jgi:pimeloyl-ACP methyl ester carboxylesterase
MRSMPITKARGFELYWETHGDPGATPLMLVMGMGGTCRGWTVLQTPELSQDRVNLLFDNRGAGRSADPGTPFTTRDMAGDALAVLDAAGVERAHVLGGFLGGLVAQELALLAPERVQSLLLVGSFARADARQRLVLELWKEMAERGMSPEVRIRNRLAWTLHHDTFEQKDLIEAMWRFYLEDDAPQVDRVFARQVDACLGHDTLARLGQIQVPVLVAAGEEDILTPPHLQRELASKLPRAELVFLHGAGHLVVAEIAPRFNRLVRRFVAEHDELA